MRRPLVWSLAPAVALGLTACSVILPYDSFTNGERGDGGLLDGDASRGDGSPTGDGGAVCGDVLSSSDHCGSCDHGCLGDPCVGGHCVATPITTTAPGGYGIDVDAQNVYWGVAFGQSTGGRVLRIGKDDVGGTGVVLIDTPQPRFEPRDVKVDGSYVAVLDQSSGNGTAVIYRVPGAGGSVAPLGMGCALDGSSGLAVGGSDLYFVSTRALGDGNRGVYRAAKSGVDCTGAIGDALPGLQQVALDGATLYFTQPGQTDGSAGSLFALPLGSSTATAIATGTVTAAWGVLPDGDSLLVTSEQGSVRRVAKDGSVTKSLTTEIEGLPHGLAADATHVYWANAGSGEIVSYTRASGERRVVASGQDGVSLLAADATRLYWTTRTHVMRLAK